MLKNYEAAICWYFTVIHCSKSNHSIFLILFNYSRLRQHFRICLNMIANLVKIDSQTKYDLNKLH